MRERRLDARGIIWSPLSPNDARVRQGRRKTRMSSSGHDLKKTKACRFAGRSTYCLLRRSVDDRGNVTSALCGAGPGFVRSSPVPCARLDRGSSGPALLHTREASATQASPATFSSHRPMLVTRTPVVRSANFETTV